MTIVVNPPLTPILKHSITKLEGEYSRMTLEIGGRRQIIFAHTWHEDEEGGNLTLQVVGAKGSIYLNRKFIAAEESGYNIYIQEAVHTNNNFLKKGVSQGTLTVTGARHSREENIEASQQGGKYSGSEEFQEVCELIPERVKIG